MSEPPKLDLSKPSSYVIDSEVIRQMEEDLKRQGAELKLLKDGKMPQTLEVATAEADPTSLVHHGEECTYTLHRSTKRPRVWIAVVSDLSTPGRLRQYTVEAVEPKEPS